MPVLDRDSIRKIFLSRHPHVSPVTASTLLDISASDMEQQIRNGEIVPVSTTRGVRIPRAELIGAALRRSDHAAIEAALGDDADRVLPKFIRLGELRARVPEYQRAMLRYLATKYQTTTDGFLIRQFDDLASAHAEELATALPGFRAALSWPDLN